MALTHTYDENTIAAAKYLARFTDGPLPHLIGGESVPSVSGDTFEKIAKAC